MAVVVTCGQAGEDVGTNGGLCGHDGNDGVRVGTMRCS
jgi:hypothetical protein